MEFGELYKMPPLNIEIRNRKAVGVPTAHNRPTAAPLRFDPNALRALRCWPGRCAKLPVQEHARNLCIVRKEGDLEKCNQSAFCKLNYTSIDLYENFYIAYVSKLHTC